MFLSTNENKPVLSSFIELFDASSKSKPLLVKYFLISNPSKASRAFNALYRLPFSKASSYCSSTAPTASFHTFFASMPLSKVFFARRNSVSISSGTSSIIVICSNCLAKLLTSDIVLLSLILENNLLYFPTTSPASTTLKIDFLITSMSIFLSLITTKSFQLLIFVIEPLYSNLRQ